MKICVPIAAAIFYMHEGGMMHRDVKPENVMITTAGDVKLIDFGISRHIGQQPEKANVDARGNFDKTTQVGTPLLWSPQIANGEQYDEGCDIWSTGVSFFFVCELDWPFPPGPATLQKIIDPENDARPIEGPVTKPYS